MVPDEFGGDFANLPFFVGECTLDGVDGFVMPSVEQRLASPDATHVRFDRLHTTQKFDVGIGFGARRSLPGEEAHGPVDRVVVPRVSTAAAGRTVTGLAKLAGGSGEGCFEKGMKRLCTQEQVGLEE